MSSKSHSMYATGVKVGYRCYCYLPLYKEVLVPRVAGCSLADSINGEQVRELRQQHPDAGIVCYVNTYAEVKAESDSCCTSSNVVAVVEAMPHQEILFIPDRLMGLNLRNMTSKKIITWDGTCVVHEGFNPDTVKDIRRRFPGVKILAHPECAPGVLAPVDYAGGTAGMLNEEHADYRSKDGSKVYSFRGQVRRA